MTNTSSPSSDSTGTSRTLCTSCVSPDGPGEAPANKIQVGFLSRWQWYAQCVEGDTWQGGKMDPGELDKMSGTNIYPPRHIILAYADSWCLDQQIGQLYELMQAIKKQQSDGEGGQDGNTPPPAA